MVESARASRVLVVNDTPSALYLATRILRAEGFEVLSAENGVDALAIARAQRPDAVLLDIRLPDIDGFEIARRLKSDPATSNIAIVQSSATFVTSEEKARGLTSGADAYLTQPFEAIELVALVRALLRLRRSEAESRERAEALIVADRRKNEFLAMLGHEIRNPLSAITVALRLMQDRLEGDPQLARLHATMERQAEHLARLVDDLLDVSRITHGKIVLSRVPIDLRAVLRDVSEAMKPALDRKGQRFVLALPDAPVILLGDATRIDQVFSNLLANAVKYTPAGGSIAMRLGIVTKGDERFAEVRVADDGIGIDPADAGSLFDLFFQVDGTLARSQSGLGIGLTMVRRLVELHGGHVRVRSEGIGRGSEFFVELPLLAPELGVDAADRTLRETVRRSQHVLLVDDNVDSCELFQMALEGRGHRVDITHDGESGLQMLLEGHYDVAVVDIGLPRLDGYELAQRVCARMGTARPRLIAMTGYGRPDDRTRTLESGFDAHLVKPVELDRLEDAVSATAWRPPAEEEPS